MSQFSGRQFKGAKKIKRQEKQQEAEDRRNEAQIETTWCQSMHTAKGRERCPTCNYRSGRYVTLNTIAPNQPTPTSRAYREWLSDPTSPLDEILDTRPVTLNLFPPTNIPKRRVENAHDWIV